MYVKSYRKKGKATMKKHYAWKFEKRGFCCSLKFGYCTCIYYYDT